MGRRKHRIEHNGTGQEQDGTSLDLTCTGRDGKDSDRDNREVRQRKRERERERCGHRRRDEPCDPGCVSRLAIQANQGGVGR